MDLTTFSAILSTLGQLPAATLFVMTCVLSGIGIGIAIAFRDIPKYSYKTLLAFLNFILRLNDKEPIDVYPEHNEEKDNNHAERIIKIIRGGKIEKDENHHEDGRAT